MDVNIISNVVTKIIFLIKFPENVTEYYPLTVDIKSIWETLLQINFDHFPSLISFLQSNNRQYFLKSLHTDSLYKISIIFNNEILKEYIGANLLNSQSDQFSFGQVTFTLQSVSIFSLIVDSSKIPNFPILNSSLTTFIHRIKTPIIVNDISLISKSNKLLFSNLIFLLSERISLFDLSLQDFIQDIPVNDNLAIDSFHLHGNSYSSGFGINGWLKLTINDNFDFIRKIFYYIDFFGLGPAGELGFGFTDVIGLRYHI